MSITIALPLDLPDVRVLASRVLEDATLLIEVESTLRTAQCHRCGREIDRFHGFDRPIRLRHLPVFGREVAIEIPRSATGVHTVRASRPPPSAVPGTSPTARTRSLSTRTG
jgi:transposase